MRVLSIAVFLVWSGDVTTRAPCMCSTSTGGPNGEYCAMALTGACGEGYENPRQPGSAPSGKADWTDWTCPPAFDLGRLESPHLPLPSPSPLM